MKVKDYVELLLKLDQEKDVWVNYDGVTCLVPKNSVATKEDEHISGFVVTDEEEYNGYEIRVSGRLSHQRMVVINNF